MRARRRTWATRATGAALALVVTRASGQAVPEAPRAPTEAVSVVAPRLLTDPEVPYPDGATGEAEVPVVLLVGVDGRVAEARLEGEIAEPFAGVALAAVGGWTFAPATRGGRAVAARIKVVVVFRPPTIVAAEPEVSTTDAGAGAAAPPPPPTPPPPADEGGQARAPPGATPPSAGRGGAVCLAAGGGGGRGGAAATPVTRAGVRGRRRARCPR